MAFKIALGRRGEGYMDPYNKNIFLTNNMNASITVPEGSRLDSIREAIKDGVLRVVEGELPPPEIDLGGVVTRIVFPDGTVQESAATGISANKIIDNPIGKISTTVAPDPEWTKDMDYVGTLGMTSDSDKNFYVVGWNGKVTKIDEYGEIVWSVDDEGSYSVTLSKDEKTLYTTDWDGVLRAYKSSDGQLVWEVDASESDIYQASIGPNGNIYTVDAVQVVRVTTPNGSSTTEFATIDEQWPDGQSICVDSSGNVYVGCGSDVVKLDSEGQQVWRNVDPEDSDYLYKLGVDSDGNVYAGSLYSFRKIDPSGNTEWVLTPEDNDMFDECRDLAIDPSEDYVYLFSMDTNYDIYASKISSDGDVIWTTSIIDPDYLEDRGGLAMSPDGHNLYFGDSGNLYKLSLQSNVYLTKTTNRENWTNWLDIQGRPSQYTPEVHSNEAHSKEFITIEDIHNYNQLEISKIYKPEFEPDNQPDIAPIIVDDEGYIYTANRYTIIKMDPEGAVLWRNETDFGNHMPVMYIDSSGLYVAGKTLYKYNPADGSEQWSAQILGTSFGSGGIVSLESNENYVWVGAGYLNRFSKSNGSRNDTRFLNNQVPPRFIMMDNDGYIYMGGNLNGKGVSIEKYDPIAKEVVWEVLTSASQIGTILDVNFDNDGNIYAIAQNLNSASNPGLYRLSSADGSVIETIVEFENDEIMYNDSCDIILGDNDDLYIGANLKIIKLSDSGTIHWVWDQEKNLINGREVRLEKVAYKNGTVYMTFHADNSDSSLAVGQLSYARFAKTFGDEDRVAGSYNIQGKDVLSGDEPKGKVLVSNGGGGSTWTNEIAPVLISPNGTKYKIIVDDDGSLSSTPLEDEV